MDQVRQVLRYHHYAYRTEQTYCEWIVRFIKFHGSQKHPLEMGKSEVEAFLSHLATNRKVAASTQRQALNALIFLYRHVLDKPVEDEIAPVKAKKLSKDPDRMCCAGTTCLNPAFTFEYPIGCKTVEYKHSRPDNEIAAQWRHPNLCVDS